MQLAADYLSLLKGAGDSFEYVLDAALETEAETVTIQSSGVVKAAPGLEQINELTLQAGDATLSLTGTTDVQAEFTGTGFVRLDDDRPDILLEIDGKTLTLRSNDDETAAEATAEDTRLFSDEPLAVSWLNDLDLNANVRFAESMIAGGLLRDLTLVAAISHGALQVAPLSFDAEQGSFNGSLQLLPADTSYNMTFASTAERLRLDLLADENQDPASLPLLDLELELAGNGNTMHTIMTSANGHITGRKGTGQLNLSALNVLFSDLLSSVVRTLRPACRIEDLYRHRMPASSILRLRTVLHPSNSLRFSPTGCPS